jgi:hypothetical protein
MAGSDERDPLPALLTHVRAFSCCCSAHVRLSGGNICKTNLGECWRDCLASAQKIVSCAGILHAL